LAETDALELVAADAKVKALNPRQDLTLNIQPQTSKP